MTPDSTDRPVPDRYGLASDGTSAGGDDRMTRILAKWENGDAVPWQRDLLVMFLRNQLRVMPAMPLLTVLLAMTCLVWVPTATGLAWLATALGCQSVQIYLCRRYFRKERKLEEQGEWIGMLSASEALIGVSWLLPLFLFWPSANSMQAIYLVASVMAVIAVRLMVVNNFMPILVAGTGVMTIGVAARCVTEGEPVFLALAGTVIALEAFFLLVARNLQETARDMLIFKAQKEGLIEELRKERDKAEEEKLKAEDASRAKSVFLATMSHELRTPLNAILGFSEILKRELFGPLNVAAYKSYADDIHHSGNYLLQLINDILDLSRIEAGRRDLAEEPVSVMDSVSEAIHLLEMKAAEKAIELSVDSPSQVPKILADGRAVGQVIINILSNAIKFTPPKGKVTVKFGRTVTGGLTLAVRDTGPGIPAHEIEAALSAFSRGSLATKKAIDGAGLGLPIAKGLMEAHGGSLEISSAPGRGTEIIMNFPPRRVLDGPRGEVMTAPTVSSESQRRLIALTG